MCKARIAEIPAPTAGIRCAHARLPGVSVWQGDVSACGGRLAQGSDSPGKGVVTLLKDGDLRI